VSSRPNLQTLMALAVLLLVGGCGQRLQGIVLALGWQSGYSSRRQPCTLTRSCGTFFGSHPALSRLLLRVS
jgi:outer membrane lipopolysaccharide assembly protein LptE/RlpB